MRKKFRIKASLRHSPAVWSILFISLVLPVALNGQSRKPVEVFYKEEVALKYDSLYAIYGMDNNLPEDYKYSLIIARSFYPELQTCRIRFKEASIKTTMNTRPVFFSYFKSPGKRTYIIRINISDKGEILLKNVPFNAQIGIFSHEIGHVKDFENRNFFGLIKRGIDYLGEKRKRTFEYEIDSLTIAKGAGYQLLDWSDYALNHSEASDKYKAFKRKIYMSPNEIRRRIKQEY